MHLSLPPSLFFNVLPFPPPPPLHANLSFRSGALRIGDHIRGINGTPTKHLNENEANALLQNSGNVINLEVEFDDPGSDVESGTIKKTAQVRLKREMNGYGFMINEGNVDNRSITVSNVIVGSFPYK